jgi:coenzyme F420 hydrogenase subunit beta
VDDPATLKSLRYRGNGWPGLATAIFQSQGGSEQTSTLTYQQSWGEVLTNHKQWRCKMCVDHTGEFADIAVGDPWHRDPKPDDVGSSLILARTERGVQILRRAIESGALHAQPAEAWQLLASQPGLLKTRGAVWGRQLGSRLSGAMTPSYRRLPMARFWLKKLTLREKAQSIVGTLHRVRSYKLNQRRTVAPWKPEVNADEKTCSNAAAPSTPVPTPNTPTHQQLSN